MLTKMHGLAGWLLVAGLALAAANTSLAQERDAPGRDAKARPAERGGAVEHPTGTLKSIDATSITISMIMAQGERGGERREAVTVDKTYNLAKDVEVAGGGGTAVRIGERGAAVNTGVLKAVKLTDLATGVKVALSLSADKKTVVMILAEGPTIKGVLKTVEATKNTITVQFPGRAGGRGQPAEAGEEKTYSVAADAEISIDDGRGGRFSIKEARLADLAQGAFVTVHLFVDMKQAQSIAAEGPSHHGTVKAIDPAKRTMTLVVREARGDDAAEEYPLTVANDAIVIIDTGKGRISSVKLGKLADVPVGASVAVKLSVDQAHVMSLRAEGSTTTAKLKAVDADKGTITISIPKGRNDEEEKVLNLAKDVTVNIDGHAAKLADLKPGDGPTVVLRFSLDQQTVQSITSRQAVGRGRD